MWQDQLFFRTTYFEAFERLEEDIQAVPDESIKEASSKEHCTSLVPHITL